MSDDRWKIASSYGDTIASMIQVFMGQCVLEESMRAMITKPITDSWALIITRLCESALGLIPILPDKPVQGADCNDEIPEMQQIEGVSDEIQMNICKLLPGQLYTWGVKGIQNFDPEGASGVFMYEIITKAGVTTDSVLAKALAGLCDTALFEMVNLACDRYRDNRWSSGLDVERENALVIGDVQAWRATLSTESKNDNAFSDDEVDTAHLQKILRDRYGCLCWMYVSDSVDCDDELSKLWWRLGLNVLVENKCEEADNDDINAKLQAIREHSNVVRNTKRELYVKYGTTGMAIKESLSVPLTPFSHRDVLDIAMKLPPVDKLGNCEGDLDLDSDVEELLTKIRSADGNTSIEISSDACLGKGASFFQVLTALTYQCYVGAVKTVGFTGTPTSDIKAMQVLCELFPTQVSMDDVEWEFDDIKLFGEKLSFQNGNRVLMALTASGELASFIKLPGIADEINRTYLSNHCSGLCDEDMMAEVSLTNNLD